MPRRKSLVTVIRAMVREQVQEAIQGLLGAVGGPKKKAKNGRRRGGAGVEDRDDRRAGEG